MVSILKSLVEERTVLVKDNTKLPFSLKDGVVRLVDDHGHTLAIVLDKETLDEIQEDIEASNPTFLASLDASRASGRISGTSVKRKLGIK